jgi:ankyrin repeat protein
MGTCASSEAAPAGHSVMPIGNNEIIVPGILPPSSQVAPAPMDHPPPPDFSAVVADACLSADGHSITTSGLYYCEHKPSLDNLVAESKKGNSDMVKELIRTGADVNTKGMWGNTPLIAACQYGHGGICDILLACAGIDVQVKNEKGASAILYASLEGLGEVCQKILTAGGGVVPMEHAIVYNSKADKSGPYTPFSAAITNGHVDVMKTLLGAGVDPNAELVDPQQKITNISDVIMTRPIMLACAYKQTEAVKLLVGLGADVMSCDSSKGYTVLHHACKTKASANTIIPLLLALVSINSGLGNKNEIVDIQSKSGDTALSLACEVSSEPAVQLLLEAGANPNLVNNNGISALHHAVKRRAEGIVQLLLDAKADPCHADAKDVSPIDMVNKLRDDSKIKTMVLAAVNNAATLENIDTTNGDNGGDNGGDAGAISAAGAGVPPGIDDMGGGMLPLVPSVAVFMTRDMLTGSASHVELGQKSEGEDKDNETTRQGGDMFEDNMQLDFLPQADSTPQKGDSVRAASGASASAMKTPMVSGERRAAEGTRGSQSTGAPVKLSSHSQQSGEGPKLGGGFNIVQIGHADLFRD